MPRLRQTPVERMLTNIKGEVSKAMTVKGWDKEHFAVILPWNVKLKYNKLCGFYRNPGTINLNDLAIMADKLGKEVVLVDKGVEKNA